MYRKFFITVSSIFSIGVVPIGASEFYSVIQPFFEEHCIKCHGPDKAKSGVRLDELPAHIEDDYTAEDWQEILDVLNGAEMPPEDEPQPSTEELAEVIAAMTDSLFEARKRMVDPKSVTIRRLNKREYANTIRDLLGVHVDTTGLPVDGTLDGFDTVGDAHFMSVPQFEKYLDLAKAALDRALVNGPRPETFTVRKEVELARNEKAEESVSRMKDLAAQYDQIISNPESNTDEIKHAETRKTKMLDSMLRAKGYLDQVASETGAILDITQAPFGGQAHDKVSIDRPGSDRGRPEEGTPKIATLGAPIGRYIARFRAGLTCSPSDGERLVVEVTRSDTFNMQVSYRHSLGVFEITQTWDDPHLIEVPFENLGELDDRIAVRVDKYNESQYQSKVRGRGNFQFPDSAKTPYVWIDWLEVEGPLIEEWPPPAWKATFFDGDTPSESEELSYAREVIAEFAGRAFRGRDAKPEFLDRLLGIYTDYRTTGSSFTESIKESLAVVLASPSFVYLVEPNNTDQRRALSDQELASRLSYFLWSHPPDAELLKLAQEDRLSNSLLGQVDRLLNDPKADHFTHAFISQWLELDWLDMIVINKSFTEFNEAVRQSMRDEPVEMFRELIRQNSSVTDFIDCDYTMADGLLSRYYGFPAQEGVRFRKVNLPADSPRGGLLGMGSVLTMTGTGDRTSPVERGVFVYEHMLGKHISPPPPNVPQLVVEDGSGLTVRQLLEAHTSQAQCASCHRRMDPLGFGLEHFDAVGQWRDFEAASNERGRPVKGNAIDARGAMPDRKRTFSGHEQLKTYLMEDHDQMAYGFLKSMLTYALGRRVGFSDGQFVEEMQAEWKQQNYGMRSLIHLIVNSEEFRSK